MKIALGSDHGGITLREAVIKAVADGGHELIDFGTDKSDSCDYPDYALLVANAVVSGVADKGILLCGTGIGMSIAANKVKGIRCAHVTDVFSAQMCAEHNNANVIALGGRITDPDTAYKIVTTYLSAAFAGGRHQRRLDKVAAIENGEEL
ncbi:MAG: ribose 5-phosphate isomerase B [Clostridiales bacterium]|jgi:ribose 5-phosphate isomerase B|nr:ribose 5-phosphate isomerase B [Clostridiales bacterium]HOB64775.1 ribose 5-phosphate isomerase B [Clostridia bacterium]HOK81360.1 ribose 5-phosphate isomerase B [Clostridia bacterium]HOL60659.1 ribose 5-phosphate isomerase B [Clostridia bacterium]HPO53236.1 ribose 5-phosphate isomerase B [Clostridia bacterium]